MTSKAEMFGAALGKAFKKTAEKIKEGMPPAKMYRTNLHDVPKVEGLKRDDGWVDMQVQFLIDKKSTGADHVVGWTVLKPGARHENHRHHLYSLRHHRHGNRRRCHDSDSGYNCQSRDCVVSRCCGPRDLVRDC